MTISVLLFAQARELAGCDEVQLKLESEATVGQVKAALLARFPVLAEIMPHCSFAVDQHYVSDEQPVCGQSEIGCIPPVSGG